MIQNYKMPGIVSQYMMVRRGKSLRRIQPAAARLYHVNEVGQGLLLNNGNRLEVSDQGVRQLSLVEARPGGHLEMFLVATQCVHLEVEEIHRILARYRLRLQRLLAVLPLPLLSHGLDERLVVLADVVMTSFRVQL